jgi:hypothetical protein
MCTCGWLSRPCSFGFPARSVTRPRSAVRRCRCGAGAGRVVRFLVDVAPPYTASAVAEFAGVSVPYVSRLLSMLDREALVE